jgi:hypothetical protein
LLKKRSDVVRVLRALHRISHLSEKEMKKVNIDPSFLCSAISSHTGISKTIGAIKRAIDLLFITLDASVNSSN